MKTLIVLILMTVSSVSYAGLKSGVVKASLIGPGQLKHQLAEGLREVQKTNFQFQALFTKQISKTVSTNTKPDGSIIKTVVHAFKDENTKSFSIEFNLSGYNHKERELLADLINKNIKSPNNAYVGARMSGKFDSYVRVSPTNNVSNADQLQQRLENIADALEQFERVTDPKRSMIKEVARMRKEAYSSFAPQGAR